MSTAEFCDFIRSNLYIIRSNGNLRKMDSKAVLPFSSVRTVFNFISRDPIIRIGHIPYNAVKDPDLIVVVIHVDQAFYALELSPSEYNLMVEQCEGTCSRSFSQDF